MIGPCTWDSQKSPAVLCTCPCLHPCTSLSRSLLPRSSWRLRPQTCTSVPQSSSQQKIYLWNSVMYELLVSLIKTKATVCSCFPHPFTLSFVLSEQLSRQSALNLFTKTPCCLQIAKVSIKYLHSCKQCCSNMSPAV